MKKYLKLNDEINLLKISEKVDSHIRKVNKEHDIKLSLIRQSDLSDFKKNIENKKLEKIRQKDILNNKSLISSEIREYIFSSKQLISDKKFSTHALNSWKDLKDDEKNIDLEVKYSMYRTPDGKRLDSPVMEDRVLFDYSTTFRDVFMTERNRIKQANSHLKSSSIKVDYDDSFYLNAILSQAIDKAIDIYKSNVGKSGAMKITNDDVKNKEKFYKSVQKAFLELYPIESSRVKLLKDYEKHLFLSTSSNPIKEENFHNQYKQGYKFLNTIKNKYPDNVISFVEKAIDDTLRIIDLQSELHKKKKEFNLNILITDSLNKTTFLTNNNNKKSNIKSKQLLENTTGKKVKPNNTKNISDERV